MHNSAKFDKFINIIHTSICTCLSQLSDSIVQKSFSDSFLVLTNVRNYSPEEKPSLQHFLSEHTSLCVLLTTWHL